jgi:ketosteroid isomerase-like protein
MKKQFLMCVTIFLLAIFSNAWAVITPDEIAAHDVIQNWFTAMRDNQVDKAASFLAPQFLSIHTDGIVRNRNSEIMLIKNLHMKKFDLVDFKFSASGDIMVVTYSDHGMEQIDKKPVVSGTAGRMAVLQKQNGKWLIVAYANLDQIR